MLKPRDIHIRCDFTTWVVKLFIRFSSQLFDGYWGDSRPEFGKYGDGYHEDIWNCFDFCIDYEKNKTGLNEMFEITLRSRPRSLEAEKDCNRFHDMSDKEIADYLRDALFEAIKDAPGAFDIFSDRELEVLEECIKNWEIVPSSPPKMTHEELVKIVGHDFEYER